MVDKDGLLVRFRLVFDDRSLLNKSQRSQGLRRCWFRLKPGLATVDDLAYHLRESFGLHDRIILSVDDFVLPAFESTRIITNKDIIKVNKKKIEQSDVSKPYGRQYLVQDSQIAIPRNLAIGNELLVDGKPKKASKGNESYYKEILPSCRDNTVHVGPANDFVAAKRDREHSNNLPIAKGQCKESNPSSGVEPNTLSGAAKQSLPSDAVSGKSTKRQRWKKDKTLCGKNNNDPHCNFNGLPATIDSLPIQKLDATCSANLKTPPKHHVSLKNLPKLTRLPVKGDILAFFLLNQSSVHPELFYPQVGAVASFDSKSLQIVLIPIRDYEILSEEVPNGAILQQSRPVCHEDCSFEVDFCSLAYVRLLKAYDSNEAVRQEEQARKDYWEEAVAKANWTEPNKSSQEKSCGWTQWNPNKSNRQTSWSCGQYSSPFPAGRNNGWTDCTQNGNKSDWAPSSKPQMNCKW